ncbi:hypothetical protein C1I97_00370 [Streptomyces sp. NTH33]|uniref:hypothetical protein n=1 Tax=Streptomyces sp. NTH33 TaxID=1735453 RepID=UPI000DA87A0A|nr:hypothetical protein [Streptomyces sp. NTH33]PZH21012.1 hypothetical protein C1I97_00370 [Streptomyces sp. NTH33]
MGCSQAALRKAITRTSGSFRILTVDGGNLTLRAAVIANGDATGSPVRRGAGGGIVVTGNGSLTVDGSVIRDNHADFGGGISVFNGSQARVNGTVVRGNSAAQNGGGLVSDGKLTVNASEIVKNTAGGAGGGIANIGTPTVTAGNIADNTAQTGGGIANGVPAASGGTTTVSFSNISHNHAADNNPGGIYNNQGTVTLQATVVAGNTPNNCRTSPTPVPAASTDPRTAPTRTTPLPAENRRQGRVGQ